MEAYDFPITEDYLKNFLDNDNPTWSSYFNLFSEKLKEYHLEPCRAGCVRKVYYRTL